MFTPYPSYPNIKILVADPPVTAGMTMQQAMAADRARTEYLRDPFRFDNYGRSVRDVLNAIDSHVTGTIILAAIQRTGREMSIQPYTPTAKDPQNAYASPADWAAATPQGQNALQCGGPNQGQPIMESRYWGLSSGPVAGTGAGSNSIVYYTPSMWSPPTNNAAAPGSRADEILLHEMLHGYRQMTGKSLCSASGMGNYDTFEEYFAIVITNMYLSEITGQSNTPLRANHHGFTILPYPDLFPDAKENRRRLQQIHRENVELTQQLALRSRGAFNPFRDLFIQTMPDRQSTTATA